MFSEIVMRLRAYAPYRYTLCLSNTNGSNLYLPSEDQLCRGGYEINMDLTKYLQPPVPNADWHFVMQTMENLKKTEN